MKWFTPSILTLFLVTAAAAFEGFAFSGHYWLVVLVAVAVALLVMWIASRWDGTQERLLKWFVQPAFTVGLVLLGYPFGEIVNDPDNHRLTDVFVSLGIALIVLAVPRHKLAHAAELKRDRDLQNEIAQLRERLDTLTGPVHTDFITDAS
jgi:hypothetical protein